MIPRKLLILILLFLSTSASIAQDIGLNMNKAAFLEIMGNPDETIIPDSEREDKYELLFYNDDCFRFLNDRLIGMDLISPRLSFTIFKGIEITIGDRFSTLVHNAGGYLFEHKMTLGSVDSYFCENEELGTGIGISVDNDIIISISIGRIYEKEPYYDSDFRIFFESCYKPDIDYSPDGTIVSPANSLWPAGINVKWKALSSRLSNDKTSAACCVPFVSELVPKATYSGDDCPPVAQRLVITEKLDGSNMFKPKIMSVVPAAGLKEGDYFTGIVFYNNLNTSGTFAWECYEQGKLVYSKYPSKTVKEESSLNTGIRFAQRIVYIGGENAFSTADWLIIASNSMNTTQAYEHMFAPGRTENDVKAEKSKYVFASSVNSEYKRPEYVAGGNAYIKKPDDVPLVQKVPDIASAQIQSAEAQDGINIDIKDELPDNLGKSDNLRSILQVDNSLIKLNVTSAPSPADKDRIKYSLYGTNDDYCYYMVKLNDGAIFNLMPGTSLLSNDYIKFRYHTYKGKPVSGIDVKFPYMLPVSPGRKVKLIVDERERNRSFAVLMNYGEPVYAMRAGCVCRLKDQGHVLISHKDDTFAAYMNIENCCVSAGENVFPGDLIGYCGGGKLSISIFYLDANKIETETGYRYTHLTPYIHTANGDVKLEAGKEYEAVSDTEIITKEMRAAQKKRYLKNKDK